MSDVGQAMDAARDAITAESGGCWDGCTHCARLARAAVLAYLNAMPDRATWPGAMIAAIEQKTPHSRNYRPV